MATLKDHQQAMVDLLASGSGIPASAARLAHAMHDVLVIINNLPFVQPVVEGGEGGLPDRPFLKRPDATTPGLNDKALAADVEALRTDSHCVKPSPAEQRIRELQNTISQLRKTNTKQKATIKDLRDDIGDMASKLHMAEKQLGRGLRGVIEHQEQAGVRKDDTQGRKCGDCGAITYRKVATCDECGGYL